MTTENYAEGYQAGYKDAYDIACSAIPGIGTELCQYLAKAPKLKTGYSIYDGGYEDGITQAIKLTEEFFNCPVSKLRKNTQG